MKRDKLALSNANQRRNGCYAEEQNRHQNDREMRHGQRSRSQSRQAVDHKSLRPRRASVGYKICRVDTER